MPLKEMTTEPFNILLVGCGKMGGAMLRRWRDLRLCKDVCVVEPANPQYLSAPTAFPSGFTPDVVIFAVKPQTLPSMIGGYRTFSDNGTLILSIAAGRTVAFFEEYLGTRAKIVRAMPNTPAAIGKGMTAAFANKNIGATEKTRAHALLAAVGEVVWLDDERQMNAVTALSGSGPAYVFLLIEMLEKAGAKLGLSPEMAGILARKTVEGSAALAEANPDVSAATLRENVTSPGGTTAAALDVLMKPETQKIFDDALLAAVKRAEELAG